MISLNMIWNLIFVDGSHSWPVDKEQLGSYSYNWLKTSNTSINCCRYTADVGLSYLSRPGRKNIVKNLKNKTEKYLILPWDVYKPHIIISQLFLLNPDLAQEVGLSYDVGPGGVDLPVQGP